MDPLKAQRELLEVAIELQRLDQRLHEVATALPRPARQDEMFEGDLPADVATELRGVIAFGQGDRLRPLIASLSAASRLTDDDLRTIFLRREREAAAAASAVPVPRPEPPEAKPSGPRAGGAAEADPC